MINLSIIIPVYNVEKYIYSCLESIYRQGLSEDDFEIILVNDGTPDNSMAVIDNIVGQHHNIVILNQENQGQSVARNNGLAVSKGKYIMFVDSDDLLFDNSLAPLVQKAIESSADLVVADFVRMNDEDIPLHPSAPNQEYRFVEGSGFDFFLSDFDPRDSFVWRTIYKKEFLIDYDIKFVPDIYYEDIPYTQECYLKASKVVRCKYPFYLYRIREGSSTASYTKKNALDFNTAIARSWKLTRGNIPQNVSAKLKGNVFVSFSNAMCCLAHFFEESSERREILQDLKRKAPDLFFTDGIKQIIVSVLYKVYPSLYVDLRYLYGKWFENKIIPMIRHGIHS